LVRLVDLPAFLGVFAAFFPTAGVFAILSNCDESGAKDFKKPLEEPDRNPILIHEGPTLFSRPF
jgi:hypothetical protein